MTSAKNFRDEFTKLVAAYGKWDDDEVKLLKESLTSSGKSLRVETVDDLQWEESESDAYEECPLVVQRFTVFLGDEIVYEGERWFGSELEDPTHTGTGGRWATIRVDDGGDEAIEAIEDFGLEVDWPDVPAWR